MADAQTGGQLFMVVVRSPADLDDPSIAALVTDLESSGKGARTELRDSPKGHIPVEAAAWLEIVVPLAVGAAGAALKEIAVHAARRWLQARKPDPDEAPRRVRLIDPNGDVLLEVEQNIT